MKNKKGFTLVEVLVTIVIISLLSGVGIVAYQSFFKTGEQRHFEALESDVLLAGNDYFSDHRDELPTGNNIGEVLLNDLVNAKYIEEVTDSKGNKCDSEYNKVYVYRENNKYVYEVCLDCGGYKSEGKYCDGALANKITITAKTKSTNKTYNALATYNAAEYTNNENVLVTFSMINNKASKFVAVNTSTNNEKSCNVGSGTSCYVDIDSSGTYKVTAYDEDNKVVAENQYFNVKIAQNGPKFTITPTTDKYQITQAECSSNKTKKKITYTIVKDNINEEYKTIQYRLNNGNYKTINGLTITEELESGHYNLEVRITNFADAATIKNIEFNISYLINLEYEIEDGNPHPTGVHEVVKGQKYDYLSVLPTHHVAYGQNLEVRWHPNNTEYSDAIRITGNTVVENNCTYKILGLMSIPVEVPSDWKVYCKNVTYDGTKQTITNAAPTNVTFTNNEQTNAGEYTIKAHIDSPLYIWKGEWTFDDKEFKCSIGKANNSITINCANPIYNGSNQNLVSSKSATGGDVYISTSSLNSSNYSSTGGTSLSSAQGKDSNSYTVYAYTPGNSNYKEATTSKSCNIGKANNSITLNCASLSYNSSNQNLISSKSASGGDVYISTSSLNSSNYTTAGGTSLSSAQGKDSKSYTVYAYTPGNSNYKETTTSKKCSIGKANNSITLNCASLSYTGSNQNLISSKSASGGDVYISKSSLNSSNYSSTGGTALSSAQGNSVGDYTVYAYTPGNSNYKETTTSKKCSIGKANNSITLNCASLSYTGSNQNLISSKSASGGDVYISKSSLNSSNYSSTGGTALSSAQGNSVGDYTVYAYTPGNGSYNATSTSKKCSIGKANNSITLNCASLSYTGSNQNLISSKSASGGDVYISKSSLNSSNYSSSGGTALSSAQGNGVGNYTVYAYTPGNGSYKEASTSKTCTIGKGSNSITLNCASLSYTGSNQNLISSKSASGGDVYISKSSLNSSNYSSSGGTALSSAQGNGGGNYTVYAYTPGNSSYKEASTSKTCSIGKATNSISLTCASLTYNGSAQNLLSAKSASGGDVYISTSPITSIPAASVGGTSLSSAQGVDAGDYIVYAYSPGNNNYSAATANVKCSIGKLKLTYSPRPSFTIQNCFCNNNAQVQLGYTKTNSTPTSVSVKIKILDRSGNLICSSTESFGTAANSTAYYHGANNNMWCFMGNKYPVFGIEVLSSNYSGDSTLDLGISSQTGCRCN